MRTLLIAKNNIKKSKGTTAVLFFLIIFATVLLYTATSVFLQSKTYVSDTVEKLNCADYIYVVESQYKDEAIKLLDTMDQVKDYETSDIISCQTVDIDNLQVDGDEQTMPSYFCPYNDKKHYSIPLSQGEEKADAEDGIYVSLGMKLTNGYSLGDTLKICMSGKEFEFTIAGFYEDLVFGSAGSSGVYQFYLSDAAMENVKQEMGESRQFQMVHIETKDNTDMKLFEKEFLQQLKEETDINVNISVYMLELYKDGGFFFVKIMMGVMLAFSVMLVIIAIVIIRFSIHVQIERNISNIGSMEAIGYTTGQIRRSIIVQFLMISSVAVAAGILLALLSSSLVGQVITMSVGLTWQAKISIAAVVFSVAVILLFISFVVISSSRKIKTITPIIALRLGIKTHEFSKNHLPLESSRGGLHFLLGIKGMLHNNRQNIVIAIIISLLTFAGVFSITMYYNFNVEDEGVINLVGLESAQVQVNTGKDNFERLKNEIQSREGVEKVVDYTTEYMEVISGENSANVAANITDDFEQLKIDKIVSGRNARYDNEVVITKIIMDKLGVSIGDSVSVVFGGNMQEFLIVGCSQQMNNLGSAISMTTQGVIRIQPDYDLLSFNVYLADGCDTKEFINGLYDTYTRENVEFYNNEDMLNTALKSFKMAISMLCLVFFVVTAMVIVLTLLLLLSLKIVREKRYYGIYKALGYTGGMLRRQMLYSFAPVIAGGSLLGLVAGVLLTNPFIGVLLSQMGIAKANFVLSVPFVAGVPVFILAVSVITILLISIKIKRITPNALFNNE